MALQFDDANVHFERGIFKAFFKISASRTVLFAQIARAMGVNDVLQNTAWNNWYFLFKTPKISCLLSLHLKYNVVI